MDQHNWSMIPMNTCDAVNLICWKSKNKQCEKRGRGEVWGPIRAGGTVVQMLQRSSEADNVLPRLPSGLDYSGASSSGSDQSRFCRDQLFPPTSWCPAVSSGPKMHRFWEKFKLNDNSKNGPISIEGNGYAWIVSSQLRWISGTFHAAALRHMLSVNLCEATAMFPGFVSTPVIITPACLSCVCSWIHLSQLLF